MQSISTDIEAHLAVLVGLPFWSSTRAGDQPCAARRATPRTKELPDFELQLTNAPLTSFGDVVLRGPAPTVVNSKDVRGPAVMLFGGLNGGLRS